MICSSARIEVGRLEVRRAGGQQVVEARHAVGGAPGAVLARQPKGTLDAGLLARRLGPDRLEAGAHQQRLRAGALEDEGDLVGVEHEVDRHQHRTHARQREADGGESVRIARQDRDAVAEGDAARRQRIGQSRADAVELGISPLHLAAGDGKPVRQALRGAAQDIGQAVAVDAAGGIGRGCGHRRLRG
jgi:hypothetical protein